MIIIRTDFSSKPETGQINRALYLALLLKKYNPVLICIPDNSNIFQILQKKRLSVCSFNDLYKIGKDIINCVVFDIKKFEQHDINLLKLSKGNHWITVQITDFGLNQQSVDFTIDASIDQIVPYKKNKKGLFGADFCILHNKYRHFNKISKVYRKKIKNIFLNLGDSLNYRQTRKLIHVLCGYGFRLKINLGPWQKKSHKKILKRIYPSLHFIGKVESLARSFFESDLALIKAGVVAYEAAACGTPALFFHSTVEQEFFASSFEKMGTGFKVSNLQDGFFTDIMNKMNLMDGKKREDMGNRGKKIVDAKGVYRVFDFFQEKDIIKQGKCLKLD